MFGDPVDNPMGWDTVPLLELGKCKNGMNFRSKDSGYEIHCLGVADFKDNDVLNDSNELPMISLSEAPSEECLLADGDIVFVRSNGNKALVGRTVMVFPGGTPTTYSGFCIRFRKNDSRIETGYLLRILKMDSVRQKMAGRGANIQNLNQQILSQLNILLPPIDLQEKYLEFIQQSDKSKFNGFKSQFMELFTLGNYPMVPIEKLVDRELKKKKDIAKTHDTIHYIDISSIDNESKQVTGYVAYQIDESPSRAQQVLKKGDILFSTVRPNLQNIAVNPYSEDNVVASTGFCVLRCTGCLPEYMWGVMLSDNFTQTMCEKASGISYPAVRDSNVLQYQIPNAPIELQKQFAAFVRQSDKSKFELKQAIEGIDVLIKSLMQQELN